MARVPSDQMNEQIETLQEQLERERRARQEAETAAAATIGALHREIQILKEVAFAANEALSIADALGAIVSLVCSRADWALGHALLLDQSGNLVSAGIWNDLSKGRFERFKQRTHGMSFAPGVGLPGAVLAAAKPIWVEDLEDFPDYQRRRGTEDLRVRAALGVPVLVGDQVRAVMEFFRDRRSSPDARMLELMGQIGAVLGRVVEREGARDDLAAANAQLTDALGELKRTQGRVVQQERLRALGQMATGIAHDFNNALMPIRGYAELLVDLPEIKESEHAQQYVRTILTASGDAAAVVTRLREFYRPVADQDVRVPVDLSRIARQIVELTRPRWHNEALMRGVSIGVETDLVKVPPILGNEPQLREAITNLVFNAVDAMPTGGRITISTSNTDDHVSIAIRDTGLGMTAHVKRHCLDPFFTTKGDRGGSGLGLGMVSGIAQRHRGVLTIDSAVGLGTTMALTFPAVELQRTVAALASTRPASAGLRVLVVDDMPAARELLRDLLVADGHHVTMSPNGIDALSCLGRWDYDLVLTDRSMPLMTGEKLAAAVKQSEKPLPVIMLSGVGQMMIDSSECPFGVEVVLPKPVTRDALRQALAMVCPEVKSA
jgi:signal transduction histidine kinase/ActR/RegA family two-component response regulator